METRIVRISDTVKARDAAGLNMNTKDHPFPSLLAERVVIFDGAMGMNIQA